LLPQIEAGALTTNHTAAHPGHQRPKEAAREASDAKDATPRGRNVPLPGQLITNADLEAIKERDTSVDRSPYTSSQGLEDNMEAEHLEKRFGVLAVEKGFVRADHVIEALRIQVTEDIDKGEHRLIGRILLEQGLLALPQIDEVLDSMGKNLPLLKEA
jgi:hypothetical protein